MDIIYSGAGGRSVDWTNKYATSEMKKFIFGSKYLETRKKDYNNIDDYIEGVPKINDTLDKEEFDGINKSAIEKIKSTKIKEMNVDFKDVYFLDLIGNYTIEILNTDRVLDEITGETSRVDFDKIRMGWQGKSDDYYNNLWKSGKISEKTQKNKEIKTIILKESDLNSVIPNVGKPKTKVEKLNSLGFEYIYGDKINTTINLKDKPLGKEGKTRSSRGKRFGLRGKKVISEDLMQSYDKFYNKVKLDKEGNVKEVFDTPYVFTRSLYFVEEMKESLENKVSNTKELINDTKELISDFKSVSSEEDRERQQKKLEDSTKLLKSLNESLERAKKYLRMTAGLRKEIETQMKTFNETDDLLDSVRDKINNAEQLTDKELDSISNIGELKRMRGKQKVKINFKEEYLKFTDKEAMPDDDYLLELFDELTDTYDNMFRKRIVEWLEKYEQLGIKLNKEFEKKLGIGELPKTRLTTKEEREAFNNPKLFIKNEKDVIRALNDLKVLYEIRLQVSKITKKKKDKEVITYAVNEFKLILKEELIPPIVPKGTGGGSQQVPFRQRGATKRAGPQKASERRLAIGGKEPYQVKGDITLFAKRINKKLKELELVI